MKICSVNGCSRNAPRKGLCNKHYMQMYNYGKILERTIHDPNEIIIESDMCRMKLYNQYCIAITETIFNLKYKEEIEKYKWHLGGNYVECNFYDENNLPQKMKLHQFIIYLSGQEVPDNCEIDHKDRNTLNNQEDNLRFCSRQQNGQNRNIQKNNTSGQRGVYFSRRNNDWASQIGVNGTIIPLGHFNTIEEAARAYNAAATKYHGEFAQLNVI